MLKITYGKHTYGKIQAIGTARGRIIVGKYCSIAGEARALMMDGHNAYNISTYPFGHKDKPITKLIKDLTYFKSEPYRDRVKRRIEIGNDVWIGYGVNIFNGVTIGDGAIIGALSFIVKDIPPYSVVVGDSQILRKRFSDEDIEFLEKLKWWDMEDQEVADIAHLLLNPDIDQLRRKYETI